MVIVQLLQSLWPAPQHWATLLNGLHGHQRWWTAPLDVCLGTYSNLYSDSLQGDKDKRSRHYPQEIGIWLLSRSQPRFGAVNGSNSFILQNVLSHGKWGEWKTILESSARLEGLQCPCTGTAWCLQSVEQCVWLWSCTPADTQLLCVLCESCGYTKGWGGATAEPQCVQGHKVCQCAQEGGGPWHLGLLLQGSTCGHSTCCPFIVRAVAGSWGQFYST